MAHRKTEETEVVMFGLDAEGFAGLADAILGPEPDPLPSEGYVTPCSACTEPTACGSMTRRGPLYHCWRAAEFALTGEVPR